MKRKRIALALRWNYINHWQESLGALEFAAQTPEWELCRLRADPLVLPRDLPHFTFDGIVCAINIEQEIEYVRETGKPAVRVDNYFNIPDIPGVFPDDQAIGQLAAEYFLDRNASHFAAVIYPNEYQGKQRAESFVRSVRPHACPLLEISDRWPPEKYQNAMETFLRDLPRPTAVFAINDDLAASVIYHARKLNIQVPGELSVLGVGDDEYTCAKSIIPLSSIRLPSRECGFQAARMLHAILKGRRKGRTRTLPPIDIVTRRSTDHFAIDDPLIAEALRFIHQDREYPIRVTDVTDHLGINRRALERRFRKHLCRSPLEEIMRMRMVHAKRLLERSDKRIGEIAQIAGFPDIKSLELQFHKREGVSPAEYRARFRRSHRLA